MLALVQRVKAVGSGSLDLPVLDGGHHADSGGMGGAIMGEAAGEIAGLQEIVGEGLDHIVERLLAVRPMGLPSGR
jgi:hypothetical protein